MKNLKGKVTMDLSEYTKLVLEVQKMRDVISLDKTYGTDVRVSVDLRKIEDIVRELLHEKYPEAELNEDWSGSWNNPSTRIAELPQEEEEGDLDD